MFRIALTGNVASGKSSVAAAWTRAGVPVVSADALSRDAVRRGAPALAEIRREFGEEFLTNEGRFDRSRMRDLVFRDPMARRKLEGLLHPRIEALRRRWEEERRWEGADLVAFEIPLLFELGKEDEFDVVVVVDAPEAVREKRLVEDRGLSREQARRMIESQGDPEAKREGADHVIENASDISRLELTAMRVLERIREDLGVAGPDPERTGGDS
ncbi:MAG: dephospho-CoA kinase [Gemmatimonadota bacterium]